MLYQTKCRLPIFLAELILKNLKTKLGIYCILCTDQKNFKKHLQKFIQHYLKHGNNLYEHWNSEKSEPHKIKFDLTDKHNLKNSNKKMALANLSNYYTSSQNTKTVNLKFRFQPGMILLI